MEHAGGDEVKDEFLAPDDDGVARVVAPVITGHDLDLVRQEVNELPLALVAPLGAGDHDVGHAEAVGLVGPGDRGRGGLGFAVEGVAALLAQLP